VPPRLPRTWCTIRFDEHFEYNFLIDSNSNSIRTRRSRSFLPKQMDGRPFRSSTTMWRLCPRSELFCGRWNVCYTGSVSRTTNESIEPVLACTCVITRITTTHSAKKVQKPRGDFPRKTPKQQYKFVRRTGFLVLLFWSRSQLSGG